MGTHDLKLAGDACRCKTKTRPVGRAVSERAMGLEYNPPVGTHNLIFPERAMGLEYLSPYGDPRPYIGGQCPPLQKIPISGDF